MHAASPAAGAVKTVLALGVTQIIGYGTLYYSFSILAPAFAAEFALSLEWVFGALSATLFASSLAAPTAGRWADRFGAGRVMMCGSVVAAFAMALAAVAPERVSFVLALLVMELASSFVLYSTAFVAIVQTGAPHPQRGITHLTMIAGFASTLFWPLTATLNEVLSWREIYLAFAALHLLVCLPLHAWLTRLASPSRMARAIADDIPQPEHPPGLDPKKRRAAFGFMLAGFALEGFVLSAILVHMVPLTAALGLGAAGVVVSTLFGPSQVASRLVNMLFGGRLAQAHLAVVAAALLVAGLSVLLLTTPWLPGMMMFAIFFGLGSGLTSIVGGTLPLELFGRRGYGANVGWASAARQFTSSLAPFVLALLMARTSVTASLWLVAGISAAGVAAFAAIGWIVSRRGEG